MSKEEQLIDLLHKEVIPAEGCTEPVALAYCAAKTREVLKHFPDRVDVFASGNIIKNVKSVTVPNSGGMIGIEASVAMGMVAGNASKELMVISDVTYKDLPNVRDYLKKDCIHVFNAAKPIKLYIRIEAYYKKDKVTVEFKYAHNNITLIQKNQDVIYKADDVDNKKSLVDEVIKTFTINEIYDVAKQLDIRKVKPLFDMIIKNNVKISQEGLENNYGAQTGKNIATAIKSGFYGNDTRNNAAAMASAGSDARMGGCALPVMTVAGSGNVGITISMALFKFAELNNKNEEKLYRALFLAILITVYIKSRIGRLSALCSPTCASAGIAAGIALMLDQSVDIVDKAVTNALAGIVGVMCDGANSSCSIKIANSVYAAYDAVNAAILGNSVTANDGLVGADVEETIDNIVYVATDDGMTQTDIDILKIMTGEK